uniref:Uncharacterized protein n=1 Tax=Helianthus annuus TaxID=4232 RepID=A0A251S1A7_HELAN
MIWWVPPPYHVVKRLDLVNLIIRKQDSNILSISYNFHLVKHTQTLPVSLQNFGHNSPLLFFIFNKSPRILRVLKKIKRGLQVLGVIKGAFYTRLWSIILLLSSSKELIPSIVLVVFKLLAC